MSSKPKKRAPVRTPPPMVAFGNRQAAEQAIRRFSRWCRSGGDPMRAPAHIIYRALDAKVFLEQSPAT